MRTFSQFIAEVWTNDIGKSSKEKSVTDNTRYNSPTDFKKNSKKIGTIGPLEIHSAEGGGGETNFTWHPKDKLIHHVVHAAEKSTTPDNTSRLKYLSAHGREDSPVRMGHVYSALAKEHGKEFVATGHSPGAQKMWDRFHDDPDLHIQAHHPDTGETSDVKRGDNVYASKKATDPAEKKIGKMNLILKRRAELANGN